MVEEIIKEKIPNAKIARLDRDTITTDKKRREALTNMKRGAVDILIGTQMVTKGHDFPDVTLVGIISADQSIGFPDFRSTERTFQILTQISGRAGRGLHPGKVIVQTYNPELLPAKEFIDQELELRKELLYPPFSRVANIRIIGNKADLVKRSANTIFKELLSINKDNQMLLLGPAPAPIALLRGKTRWQILIKSKSAKTLANSLSHIQSSLANERESRVQVSIDVDPISTM